MAFKLDLATPDDIQGLLDLSLHLVAHPIVEETFPSSDPQVNAWLVRRLSEMVAPSKPFKGGVQPRVLVVRDESGKVISYGTYFINPGGPVTYPGSWRDRVPPIDAVPHLTEEKLDYFWGDVERVRQHVMGERPFIWLENLGTYPEHRKKGYATSIISWGADLADQLGVEFYLSSAMSAIGLYEKHGFVLQDASGLWQGLDELPLIANIMAPMVRPAKAVESLRADDRLP